MSKMNWQKCRTDKQRDDARRTQDAAPGLTKVLEKRKENDEELHIGRVATKVYKKMLAEPKNANATLDQKKILWKKAVDWAEKKIRKQNTTVEPA